MTLESTDVLIIGAGPAGAVAAGFLRQQGRRVSVRGPDGQTYDIEARFLLDASGFGRTLPRLLKLETPSNFPVRGAIFTHVADRIPPETGFDRQKIRVTVHPKRADVWFWTIP